MSSYLSDSAEKGSTGALLSFGLAFVLAAGGMILVALVPLIGIAALAGCAVCIQSGFAYHGQYVRFKIGIEGEEKLKECLKRIVSAKYTAFYNVPTHRGDIDCVLVGPSGLYAFEIKNHQGIVVFDRATWLHVKLGARGKPYRGALKNPSLQLLAGVQSLKEHLAENGVKDVWVEAAVIFTHPGARLTVKENNTSVKGLRIEDLGNFIKKNESIPEELKNNIESIISGMGSNGSNI